jgi:4-carboxymuconolactone decarboxylase
VLGSQGQHGILGPPPATAEPELQIRRAGSRPVTTAPAENLIGTVKVEMLYTPVGVERASAGNVSFMPGARTAWHRHPLGQTLVVTAGIGRVQRWGGPVEEIRVGDVVHIPPNTKHWHGAAADSAMTHVAITEALDGKAADWMEHVTEAQYLAAPAKVPATAPTSQGQQLFDDIAPKFAQLTDEVLLAMSGRGPAFRSATAAW